MEMISLKLDEQMLKDMDSTLKKHHYSTRTEFVRDAIREKLEGLTREELMAAFLDTAGKAKKHVSDTELKHIREQAIKELAKEKGWKL